MPDNQNSTKLTEISASAEEIFGPPKVDFIGFWLILVMSIVVGFLSWVGVLIFSYFTSNNFSFQSWVSPMLLSMAAFFCLTIANYLYVWGLATIFPDIYSKTRTIFVQVSIFSVILYIIMAILYPVIATIYTSSSAVLWAFAFHVIANVFWLILLTGILSLYRYSILIFYADFAAFAISSLVVLWVYLSFSWSGSALFILMALSAISFFISTLITFGSLSVYYHLYRVSWADPIGDVLAAIEKEEEVLKKEAEALLFTKK